MVNKIIKHITAFGKYSLLPILAAIYPILLYYSNNLGKIGIIPFSQLGDLFTLFILIALVVYSLFYLLSSLRGVHASLAGLIFIILFNLYGIAFEKLRGLDVVETEHFLFIPLYFLFAVYFSWFIARLITQKFSKLSWTLGIIFFVTLILLNLAKIVPYEIKRAQDRETNPSTPTTPPAGVADKNHPDIYYFIFDEYVGFNGMRNYWKYTKIDDFVNYLKSEGFYIAENSHAYPSTIYELASRLNYDQTYPTDAKNEFYYSAMSHNKVMLFLKEHGYTTVTFDGLYYAWTEREKIIADYAYQPAEIYTGGYLNSEFERLVLQNTMVLPFLYNEKQDDQTAVRNRSMIFYTIENVSKITEVPTPKFVYVHLMLPHEPFLFTADGAPLDPQSYEDWNYYLGNYIYATKVAQEIVSSLLSSANPDRPPVIILQSDHGARIGMDIYTAALKDYPDVYRTLIMNALYLPGCDTKDLTQDMNPFNTFPIVFNCYFEANIPLK